MMASVARPCETELSTASFASAIAGLDRNSGGRLGLPVLYLLNLRWLAS